MDKKDNENGEYFRNFLNNHNSNKNSNIISILIGVIITLIIVIIGFSVLFLKQKDSKNIEINNNSENSEQIIITEETKETETSAAIMIATAASDFKTEIQKEETTIKNTNTTTTIQTEPAKTQVIKENILSYKDSYEQIINDKIRIFKENGRDNFDILYTLFDMDSDGTPELLIRSGTCEADYLISIYTFKNNTCSRVGDNLPGSHTGFAFDYIANQIVFCNAHMGSIILSWYDIDESGNLRFLIDTSSSLNDYNTYDMFMTSYNVSNYPFAHYSNYSDITYVYYGFDNYESYADYEYHGLDLSFIDNYEGLKAKVDNVIENAVPASKKFTPPHESYAFAGVVNTNSSDLNVREKPSKDSSVIGKLPKGTFVSVYYIDGYSDWYKIYCSACDLSGYVSSQYIISEDLYNQSDNYPEGRIATEKDPLNLRDEPSTSGNVIIKMPKGSYVSIMGAEGDWYYVRYTENGVNYYGYANSKYIN